ncbi:hypothetical protein RRG08_024592 [Elysia crispata]|uniref:Uncharacterized protein n=1 Tax=Elysia crispata TaxID=231223 RepID=A0AAE0ZWP3_9GAST|nr:hypothetical protein RRG08_024592 [Elysia crispata]
MPLHGLYSRFPALSRQFASVECNMRCTPKARLFQKHCGGRKQVALHSRSIICGGCGQVHEIRAYNGNTAQLDLARDYLFCTEEELGMRRGHGALPYGRLSFKDDGVF